MQSLDEIVKETARRQEEVFARLQHSLKSHRLAIIVGAGVTLNATADTSGKPLSRITWTGLIRNGLDYLVCDGYVDASNRRTKRAYEALEDPEVDGLLDAANILSSQLKQHGQFPTWLESVFGSLSQEIRHPALLDALMALHKRGAILLTTNYDDILEKHCGLQRIGRSNQDDVSRYRRGDLDRVFHLHGSYHDAHEVVLDTTDYYDVKNSDIVQDILRAFLQDRTILFVGCGSGLEDPNFDALLKWASELHRNIPNRHCLLIRDSDTVNYQPLLPVRYGPRYEDLVVYLRRLLDDNAVAQPLGVSAGLDSIEIPPKLFRVLPFGRNKDFVGRQSYLDELIRILHDENTEEDCERVALVGLGGVGKTQIALECAFQLQSRSPTCSLFWVRASDGTSFDTAYRKIGEKLNIPGLEDDKADVKRLVKAKLSQESTGKWLMIIDNADNFEIFYSSSNEDNRPSALSEYLPFSTLGTILFTTRDRNAARRYAGSKVIEIDNMDDNESRELLQGSLQNKQLLNDTRSVNKLLELLVNLPLAIMQAAAYLFVNDITIGEYLKIYEESGDNFIKLLSRDFDETRRYPDMKNPVATTWLISFEQIQVRDPKAADCMAFISCIKEQDIPRELLPLSSELEKTEALGTLKAYGFIKERISGVSYDMHRLVYTSMRNWLTLKHEWSSWNEKSLRQVANIFPWPQHENRAIWLMYLPHAQCITATFNDRLSRTKEIEEALWRLLYNLGGCSWIKGQYREAEALYRQTRQLREKVLGPEHPDTLASTNNLANLLCLQGKYEEAVALHRQTLQLQEKVLGPEHPDTLASINNVAISLCQQGKYVEAEALHRQTRQLREKVLGPEHPDTLASIMGLAISLCQQGKYVEAEALHRQTRQLREKVLGPEHPDTLASTNNLASLLCQQGKYVEAEALYRQTRRLKEKVLGPEHPDTLASIMGLASLLCQQGKYAEADAVYQGVDSKSYP